MTEIPNDVIDKANQLQELYGDGKQGYVAFDIAVLAIMQERERCIAEMNNFINSVQVSIEGRERFNLSDINRECKTAMRYVRDRLTGDFDANWIERPL